MAQQDIHAVLLDNDVGIAAIRELGERYVYRDQEAVQAYLGEHPHLANVLREAEPEIVRHFDEAATVALDVFVDPDTIGEQILFGYIRTRLPPRDAVATLRRFDRESWIERSAPVRDELEFNIEME